MSKDAIRSVIESIQSLIGAGRPEFGKVAYRLGESMALFPDVSKAERLLAWRPLVSLNDGLAETIAWSRTKGAP